MLVLIWFDFYYFWLTSKIYVHWNNGRFHSGRVLEPNFDYVEIKYRNQFYSWYWNSNTTAVVKQKISLTFFLAIKKNNMHTTPSQNHIAFIAPSPKGIGNRHNSDNRLFNCKDSNSNINELSSLVIPVPLPLNDSVINPPQMSSVCQESSISS